MELLSRIDGRSSPANTHIQRINNTSDVLCNKIGVNLPKTLYPPLALQDPWSNSLNQLCKHVSVYPHVGDIIHVKLLVHLLEQMVVLAM